MFPDEMSPKMIHSASNTNLGLDVLLKVIYTFIGI